MYTRRTAVNCSDIRTKTRLDLYFPLIIGKTWEIKQFCLLPCNLLKRVVHCNCTEGGTRVQKTLYSTFKKMFLFKIKNK